ncbi:MAG: YihY/virulence factor BrkB family protein, partial [Bryobacteraceae bacterium]
VFKEIRRDKVFGRAAELSYFFLFSLFPLLLVFMNLLGFFASEESNLRESLLTYLSTLVPVSAFQLISQTLDEISDSAGGAKLSIGILIAFWASSNGMAAITSGLNAAYNVEEARPWWRARIVAILLTIALAVLGLSALLLLLFGDRIGHLMAARFGMSDAFTQFWNFIRWPILLTFAFFAFCLIYRFAPNLKVQRWRWIIPGSVVGVVLWLLVSFALRTYLRHFNTYSNTYGSLGAVVILMLWFYLSGAAILIGGEVNSEIEREAALHGNRRAKLPGQKSPEEITHGEFSSGI